MKDDFEAVLAAYENLAVLSANGNCDSNNVASVLMVLNMQFRHFLENPAFRRACSLIETVNQSSTNVVLHSAK